MIAAGSYGFQRGDDGETGGAQGGEQTADDADGDGENEALQHEEGRDAELKDRFTETLETQGADGIAVHGKGNQAAQHSADKSKERTFDQEGEEDGAAAVAENAESAD